MSSPANKISWEKSLSSSVTPTAMQFCEII
jgi:hypothetical protein